MEKYPSKLAREIATVIPGKKIFHGLDSRFVNQLISKSRQPHILSATPKDANERFSDEQSLAEWLAKGRDLYLLTGGNSLAGSIWYGRKEMPLSITRGGMPHHTFAIRIYEGYQGKNFAEPFMHDSLVDYVHLLDDRDELENFKGIWLSTKTDNFARNIYGQFGFKEVAFAREEVIMVLPVSGVAEHLGA